jgi:hypothetical protein
VGEAGCDRNGTTPKEFGRYLAEDIAKWERIVKISGAKPDQ